MKRIAVLLTVLLTVALGSWSRVYLVCAGIADYPGTKNDLRLPAKDAKAFYDLCKLNNQAVANILLDDQATRSKILDTMEKIFSQAGTEDQVIFFFSGHGYKGGMVAYDGRLPYSDIRSAMAKSSSKYKMIFADACYSGKFRENQKENTNEDSDAKKANVLLFLSSRSTEKSYERRNMENGMYTTYLNLGLRGHADANRDRVISAKELFNYVSKNVSSVSGGKQHPVMWGNFSDSMPIMSW